MDQSEKAFVTVVWLIFKSHFAEKDINIPVKQLDSARIGVPQVEFPPYARPFIRPLLKIIAA